MVSNNTVTSDAQAAVTEASNYDRKSELIAFDDTKAGVKGLVDAGITKVPRMFHEVQSPADECHHSNNINAEFNFPVIDLDGIVGDPIRRKEAVEKVRGASEKGGFFQVVNDGIPLSTMEEMLEGVHNFFEQDVEVKKQWYTRDAGKRFGFTSNFNLFRAPSTNWRDTFKYNMAPNPPNRDELPQICSAILLEFPEQVKRLGCTLLELLSEALRLNRDHLNDIGCGEDLIILGHYYPACPQPKLTMGTSRHSDHDFFTVILQDLMGGLQVAHQGRWIDVSPYPGALVVNIGDILQLITNDKFISAEHRVLANHVGPRVSVAFKFFTGVKPTSKKYQPIEELLSENDPPKYRATTVKEFLECCLVNNIFGEDALSHFKLQLN